MGIKGVEKLLGHIGDLPAVPETVADVLRLTNDPNVTITAVSQSIERDPALAAKLLKVSNSPYFGMSQIVGTLKLALVVLGIREVRNLVLGIALFSELRDKRSERLFLRHNFWDHSCKVAGMARKLSQHYRLDLEGEDFTAGLLHDIGKLILWSRLPEYETLFVNAGGHSARLVEAERAAFGFDHADAAAVLAARWQLPDSLVDAIWRHHPGDGRELETAANPQLAALVRIANESVRVQEDSARDGQDDMYLWFDVLEDKNRSGQSPWDQNAVLQSLHRELHSAEALTI